MVTKELLEDVKQRLVKAFNPVEIYLFGSYAWGKPHQDSDIDLLVLLDKPVPKPWEEQRIGYHVLFDLDTPKDIIVSSKATFDQRAQDDTSLFYKIKEKGVKLYAKA